MVRTATLILEDAAHPSTHMACSCFLPSCKTCCQGVVPGAPRTQMLGLPPPPAEPRHDARFFTCACLWPACLSCCLPRAGGGGMSASDRRRGEHIRTRAAEWRRGMPVGLYKAQAAEPASGPMPKPVPARGAPAVLPQLLVGEPSALRRRAPLRPGQRLVIEQIGPSPCH